MRVRECSLRRAAHSPPGRITLVACASVYAGRPCRGTTGRERLMRFTCVSRKTTRPHSSKKATVSTLIGAQHMG